MSGPQVGDVITTVEQADALPPGAVLIDRDGDVWDPDEGDWYFPATLVYLPGRPPRPERVVKAEALREVAAALEREAFSVGLTPETAQIKGPASAQIARFRHYADRIERGDLP